MIPGGGEEGDYVHNVTQDLRPTMLSVCWFGWFNLLNAELSLTGTRGDRYMAI